MLAVIVLALLLLLSIFSIYGLISEFKLTALIVAGGFAIVFIVHLALFMFLPAELSFASWTVGNDVFGYQGLVNAPAWVFSLAFLTILLMAGFSSLTSLENVSKLPAVCLSIIGLSGLLTLWAGSLLSLAFALAMLDVSVFASLFFLRQRTEVNLEEDTIGRRISVTLGFDLLSTLSVIAAALFAVLGTGGAELPFQSGLALLVAAVFRVSSFSFTASQSSATSAIPPEINLFVNVTAFIVAGRLLFTAAPALALGEVNGRLLLVLLVLGLYGALRVWLFSAPRIGLMQVVFAQACLLALTAVFGGALAQTAVMMQTFAVALGLGILFTYQKPRHNAQVFIVLAFIGAAALVGLPLTAGFVGQYAFLSGLSEARQWMLLVVALLIQVLLVTGYLRILFGNNPDDLPESQYSPGYLTVLLGLPCLLVFVFGILPIVVTSLGGFTLGFSFTEIATAPGFLAVGATLFALMLGVVLWYLDAMLRPLLISIREALFSTGGDVVSSNALKGATRFSNGIGAVLEGEGAVLWALVLIVLFASVVM